MHFVAVRHELLGVLLKLSLQTQAFSLPIWWRWLTGHDSLSSARIERAGATIVNANFTGHDQWLHNSNESIAGNADFLTGVARYFVEPTYNPYNITSLAEVRGFKHGFVA